MTADASLVAPGLRRRMACWLYEALLLFAVGLIATLVDVAGGQFGLEHLRPGTTMTTADLFIRYLRPIRQGSAFAVPRMLRSGRRAMVMQVDIYGDGDGELLATATVNFAIISGPTPSGLRADD